MAVTSIESHLSFYLHGLYSLQGKRNGRILSRAAYVVLDVTVEGYKDILSITVGPMKVTGSGLGCLMI